MRLPIGPGLGRPSTSAIAGWCCRPALAVQQLADRGHDFGHDAEMTVVIERDQWQAYVAHLPAPPQTASAMRSANTLIAPRCQVMAPA
jgi:hypothetical protein